MRVLWQPLCVNREPLKTKHICCFLSWPAQSPRKRFIISLAMPGRIITHAARQQRGATDREKGQKITPKPSFIYFVLLSRKAENTVTLNWPFY